MKYFHYLLLFTCCTLTAQHTYPLDYILEYDLRTSETATPMKRWFWVNSNDNSFLISMQEGDKSNMNVLFWDYGVCSAYSSIDKTLISGGGAISYDCKLVHRATIPKAGAYGSYDVTVTDTIIGGVNMKSYVAALIGKPSKNTEAPQNVHFLIEPHEGFSACLQMFPTDWYRFNVVRPFPSGIITERYILDEKGNKKAIYRLKDMAKISNSVIFLEECDFTLKE